VQGEFTTWHVPVPDATTAASFVSSIMVAGAGVTDLEIVSPSLDDVFLHHANAGVPA
jgi:hypothetical protein